CGGPTSYAIATNCSARARKSGPPAGIRKRKPTVRACPASSFLELSIVANGTVGPTPGLNIKRAALPDNLFIVHSHPSPAGVRPIVAFHTALQAQPRADLSPRSAAD